MSAWIVSRRHIDVVVQALASNGLIQSGKENATGRLLWKECLASVAYRYPRDGDGDRPGPNDFRDSHVDTYTFTPLPEGFKMTPGVISKTAGCLSYQSCEHPGWDASKAKVLLDALKPFGKKDDDEYDDEVPWGWHDENVNEWAAR